ncbi:hypothetical protein Btru_059130 [Bulinus truncatus]|nr:hypothetical protein Btru_059130 [Bulinus truncatus]
MRDFEQYKQKELAHIKQESDEIERMLRDRITKMESQRLDLEEEISRLKASNMSDKLNAEEQLATMKHRLKSEEEQRHVQLEEKIRYLQTSKDELQSLTNQQVATISQLQHKNSNLQLEVENLRRQMDELNQELSQKNNYTMAEVGKVKVELNKSQSKLDQERSIQSELREKLVAVDSQLSEKPKGRELELVRLRERAQRVVLQSAILNYVGNKHGGMSRLEVGTKTNAVLDLSTNSPNSENLLCSRKSSCIRQNLCGNKICRLYASRRCLLRMEWYGYAGQLFYRVLRRVSTQQIGKLQVALDERKGAFNSLAAKLSMAETELALSEQRVSDYNSTINRLKVEMQELAANHVNEMRKEKEDRANEELKYLKEISETQDKNMQLQNKVEDLERKPPAARQIYDLKEQVTPPVGADNERLPI